MHHINILIRIISIETKLRKKKCKNSYSVFTMIILRYLKTKI